MSLAAVVLSFNHPHLTSRCIDSIYEKLGLSVSVFVVHNGSDTKNVEHLKAKYTQSNHVVSQKNVGFAGGANLGLKAVFDKAYDQAFFLSNDITVQRFDNSELEQAACNSDAVLCAVTVYRRNSGQIESMGGKLNLFNGRLYHLKEPLFAVEKDFSRSSKYYVPGSAFVINRAAFKLTAGFDAGLGTYWEDVDLSLRGIQRGVKLRHLRKIAVNHGIAKTTKGNPVYSVYFFQRNRKKVALKYGSFFQRGIFRLVYGFEMSQKLIKFTRQRDWLRFRHLCNSIRD